MGSSIVQGAVDQVVNPEKKHDANSDIHALTQNWFFNFVLNNCVYTLVLLWEYFT